MAIKKTPEELRKQALDIMNKAKELEKEENVKIGVYIRSLANANFNVGYDEIKSKVYELLGITEKLPTGNPKEVLRADKGVEEIA